MSTTRVLSGFVMVAVLAGCGGSPKPGEPASDGSTAAESAAPVKPLVAPEPPLPDPKPDGLTITLTKFAQLPPSKTNPPAPRGDKLDRYDRINYLGELPDGSGRLYVPDLNGSLYLLHDGKPTKYLDVAKEAGSDLWTSRGFGSGFGFVAFDPEFAKNGIFYTIHTEAYDALKTKKPDLGSSDEAVVQGVLTEWTAKDPTADRFAGKRREVMRLAFPAYIHGIQQISFNPYAAKGDADYGLLYMSVGDGGAVGKAAEAKQKSDIPQDLSVPQGKILRIDPGAKGARKWSVPTDNPFVDRQGALGEIYAYGLRDPYRYSWDSQGSHRMLLGSMGENRAESIYDVHPGDNFGWPVVEGPFTAHLLANCDVTKLPDDRPDFTYPVAAYSHLPAAGSGPCDDTGYAIIGGFVYRGKLAALRGQYVFGDGVNGRMFHIDADQMQRGGALAPVHELTLVEGGKDVTMREIASDPGVLTAGKPRVDLRFGMDRAGELYVLSKSNGTIWRVTAAARK
ncbi:MAG: PQQ-dependent sugar dehydrogenase [Aeromicrobium sp.]